MQNGSQARSADLVHTYSGERVSKVMFKSTFDLPIYHFISRGRNMVKTVLLVPIIGHGMVITETGC